MRISEALELTLGEFHDPLEQPLGVLRVLHVRQLDGADVEIPVDDDPAPNRFGSPAVYAAIAVGEDTKRFGRLLARAKTMAKDEQV